MATATDGAGWSSDLYEQLFDLVAANGGPSDRVGELVLASYEGDAQLAKALGEGHAAVQPQRVASGSEPPGTYVEAIRIQGFRGIGPASTLRLQPGPGLTVVCGRNGSGKSSFAEGLEMALTGDNARWRGKTQAWRADWRNLHHGSATEIEVALVTEGRSGATTVRREWGPDDSLDAGAWTVQEPGAKRSSYVSLRWQAPLSTYRPFLSYSELGGLIEGRPSEMYDALQGLLGLDPVLDAGERLTNTRKSLDTVAKAHRVETTSLRALLATKEDPRSRESLRALDARSLDLAALERLIASEDEPADLGILRSLVDLPIPTSDQLDEAVAELQEAERRREQVGDVRTASADRVAQLLDLALTHHESDGDTACPVCDAGQLNAEWAERARSARDRLAMLSGVLRDADDQLVLAIQRLRALVRPTPAVLNEAVTGIDTTRALAAWRAWEQAGTTERSGALVTAVQSAAKDLWIQCESVRSRAQQILASSDESWIAVAGRVASWVAGERRIAAESVMARELKQAADWLSAATQTLRDERLRPLADQSGQIWETLRQESNVELGPVRLVGRSTQRRVTLDVTVDGVPSAALSVMSQGELHALGLALFLPRATAAASPFRFVVIDDPVQAMDPAKVDGLARVLHETSLTRQVVVFTHDDRLPEAIRRLEVPATIWEVTRRPSSEVELKKNLDPVQRCLEDAKAILATPEIPDDLKRVLVPGYCRVAVETRCHQVVRERRLRRGDRHYDVETSIDLARTTNQKLALALFDDAARGGDVLTRCNAWGRESGDVVQAVKRGPHEPHRGSLEALVTGTRALTDRLRP